MDEIKPFPPRYLYVVDEEGNEIEGSRRLVPDDATWREVVALEGELRLVMSEECEIRDTVLDEDWI